MTRNEIYHEIEEKLGLVPSFMKSLPDEYLEQEWEIFKRLELGETKIPNKYKDLIGLGLSAATKCKFCTLFHAEAAKLHGATDAEIEEVARYAKMSVGWSTYIHGIDIDYQQYKDELRRIFEFVRSREEEKTKASV